MTDPRDVRPVICLHAHAGSTGEPDERHGDRAALSCCVKSFLSNQSRRPSTPAMLWSVHPTRRRWRLGHRPALDGLRGVAVLLVLVTHFDNPTTSPCTGAGVMGVTVFFTLSGFLITSLLLDEKSRTGRVSLLGFYRRRALRLFPALFVAVAASLLLGVVSVGMAASVVAYASNWFAIAHPGINGLSHTWSLGIEEQFYLAWPPLVLLAMRRGSGTLMRMALFAALLSTIEYLVLLDAEGLAARVTEATDTRVGGILLGCALAAWMHGRPEHKSRPLLAGVLLAAMVVFIPSHGPIWAIPVVVPFMTCVVIYSVAQGQGVAWLATPAMRFIGRRSYGIYVWHFPVLAFGWNILADWAWQPRAAVLLAVGLTVAMLSWRYVERPFLRMKDRAKAEPTVVRNGTAARAL